MDENRVDISLSELWAFDALAALKQAVPILRAHARTTGGEGVMTLLLAERLIQEAEGNIP